QFAHSGDEYQQYESGRQREEPVLHLRDRHRNHLHLGLYRRRTYHFAPSIAAALPDFGTVTTTNNDGKTWYHSAQFSLNKRFSKGWGLQAAYTWSKWLQATEYLNAGDAKPTKMISDQDIPHRFSMSGFYELPFGKGKQF